MSVHQDVVAMSCLELAHRNGHWVILNNIHLMPSWLIELEKKLDEFALEGSHEKFRLYLSSDPSNAIPIGVLSRCIKLTNEPPAGLKANLKRAFANFSREYIEEVNESLGSILYIQRDWSPTGAPYGDYAALLHFSGKGIFLHFNGGKQG